MGDTRAAASRATAWTGRRAAVASVAAALALTGCNRGAPTLVDVPTSPSPSAASPAPVASATPSPSPSASPSPLDTSVYNQCQASLTRPSPPSGGRQTIRVRSVAPAAPVAITLSYGGRTQSLTATTDPGGKADVLFRTLEGIRAGTVVQVDVTVASSGRCS
ncbi:MAG: hypothetical protein ACRDKW_12925, partial [Actinomycetota bacterium]